MHVFLFSIFIDHVFEIYLEYVYKKKTLKNFCLKLEKLLSTISLLFIDLSNSCKSWKSWDQ